MYGKANGRIVTASLSASFFFAMAVLALAVFAPAAQAEERVCRGTIGATTVDNLLVPQGATCTLNGTRIEGTVKVERNATLTASGIRVKGNVQGEGFKHDPRQLPGQPEHWGASDREQQDRREPAVPVEQPAPSRWW